MADLTAGLSRLPEELLVHIVSFLPVYRGKRYDAAARRALIAVSLTCRALSRAAAPMLYHTFDLSDDIDMLYETPRPRLFLQTLVQCPDKARLVRSLVFNDNSFNVPNEILDDFSLDEGPDTGMELDESLDEEEIGDAHIWNIKGLREAFSALELPRGVKSELEMALRQGDRVGMTAMIIGLCKHIEAIDITGLEVGRALPMYVLRHVAPSSLKAFRLWNWEQGWLVELEELRPVLQISSLRTITGFALSCTADSLLGDLDFAPSTGALTSHITSLTLLQSVVEVPGLEIILKTCPALLTLNIELADASVGDSNVDYPGLAAILVAHGQQLEEFRLDPQHANSPDCSRPMPAMTSIQSLTALRRLIVPRKMLFQEAEGTTETRPLTDILPFSLSLLEIQDTDIEEDMRDDPVKFDEQLMLLATDSRFRLQSIRIETGDLHQDLERQMAEVGWQWSDFTALASRNGAVVDYISEDICWTAYTRSL